MSYELIFTSSQRGLKPGTRGFTTVAMTQGMPAHCAQLCESLSGYLHVFDLSDPRYDRNPVAWSHYIMSSGGRSYSIASRVSSHPRDYTGRTNKIAHHIMLQNPEETSALQAGPSGLLLSPNLLRSNWNEEPHLLKSRQFKMQADTAGFRARAWEAAQIDPGWAALLAACWWQDPMMTACLVFAPEQTPDLLPLLHDAVRLLPPARQWRATFCTYFTSLPHGASCAVRGCLPDSQHALRATRSPDTLLLNLVNGEARIPPALQDDEQRFGSAARTGIAPKWKADLEPKSAAETAENDALRLSTAQVRTGRRNARPSAPLGPTALGSSRPRKNRLRLVLFLILVLLTAATIWVFLPKRDTAVQAQTDPEAMAQSDEPQIEEPEAHAPPKADEEPAGPEGMMAAPQEDEQIPDIDSAQAIRAEDSPQLDDPTRHPEKTAVAPTLHWIDQGSPFLLPEGVNLAALDEIVTTDANFRPDVLTQGSLGYVASGDKMPWVIEARGRLTTQSTSRHVIVRSKMDPDTWHGVYLDRQALPFHLTGTWVNAAAESAEAAQDIAVQVNLPNAPFSAKLIDLIFAQAGSPFSAQFPHGGELYTPVSWSLEKQPVNLPKALKALLDMHATNRAQRLQESKAKITEVENLRTAAQTETNGPTLLITYQQVVSKHLELANQLRRPLPLDQSFQNYLQDMRIRPTPHVLQSYLQSSYHRTWLENNAQEKVFRDGMNSMCNDILNYWVGQKTLQEQVPEQPPVIHLRDATGVVFRIHMRDPQ